MLRMLNRRSKPAGLTPGSLVYVGEQKETPVAIEVFDYDQDRLKEEIVSGIAACAYCRSPESVSWINITGVHDTSVVAELGALFDIHGLVLEDVVNTGQRPKFEDHGDYIYVVLKMLTTAPSNGHLEAEQVSLVLLPGCVITFQERPGDILDPIRQRLREDRGRIRKMGADYLAYALIDLIVDHYYVVLETIAERLEKLEDSLLQEPSTERLRDLHEIKREVIYARKAVWPLRELTSELRRTESTLIAEDTRRYIQDVYDHVVQVMDSVDTGRDILSGLQDLYLSNVSNRMNEVMKTLTIMATIFIPLTFVAGIYGMNFDHMPELHMKWGYPGAWAVMAGIAALLVVFFKRKKWL